VPAEFSLLAPSGEE
jgi:hypothetical protein